MSDPVIAAGKSYLPFTLSNILFSFRLWLIESELNDR